MDVDRFFANSGAIGCLAFLGTVVSTFVIALLVWAAGALGLCAALSFLEASLFGSIVSATDPVSTGPCIPCLPSAATARTRPRSAAAAAARRSARCRRRR